MLNLWELSIFSFHAHNGDIEALYYAAFLILLSIFEVKNNYVRA